MTEVPDAVNRDHKFFAVIAERLAAQNVLLGEIRDRLPAPQGGQPAAAPEPPAEVEVTEPADPPAPDAGSVPLSEPAAPARRAPAKKPTAKAPAKKPGTPRARSPRTPPKKGT